MTRNYTSLINRIEDKRNKAHLGGGETRINKHGSLGRGYEYQLSNNNSVAIHCSTDTLYL